MVRLAVFLLLLCSCTNDRPWKVIEIREKGEECEYVLSRSNGFGPQLKIKTDSCAKYQLFQTITPNQ